MYIIDKLISTQTHSEYNSTDYILSSYFLKHIHNILDLNITKIEKDTLISKSSISRFCKHSGFSNLKNFLSEYYIETEEMKNNFVQNEQEYHYSNLQNYLHAIEGSLNSSTLEKIIGLINKAHRILLYGPFDEIALFHRFVQLLTILQKEVIYSNIWNVDSFYNRIKNIENNDLIIIVDTSLNFYSYSLRMELSEENQNLNILSYFHNNSIIYIGLPNQSSYPNNIYHINLPFTNNHFYYQNALLEISHKFIQGLIQK